MPKNTFQNVIFTLLMAFVLEFFIVDKIAHFLAFRIVTPGVDKPIYITFAISAMIVAIMCPVMSFIAALLFKDAGSQLIAVWLQTSVFNFPMAFFWQFFYAGPFVRLIFRHIFKNND